MADPQMVKCADCGFLTFRNYQTREFVEAELELREKGVITPSHGQVPSLSDYPLCFANAVQLPPEYAAITNGELEAPQPDAEAYASITHHGESSADEHILRWRVMHRQRVCNAFTPWQQGFTPKEHREMVDRQWMIDREDRRDKEMRDREDRRDREAKSRHRNELVVFGLVLGALTIIGSMIQAGWFPNPW